MTDTATQQLSLVVQKHLLMCTPVYFSISTENLGSAYLTQLVSSHWILFIKMDTKIRRGFPIANILLNAPHCKKNRSSVFQS